MDARQMTAMAEATRLTRQGRLVEATALIQQTLAGPAVTWRAPYAPSAREESGSAPDYHLNVPAPLPVLGGRSPRRILPGWTRRSHAFPDRGMSGAVPDHRSAVPAAERAPGRFDAFSYTNAAGTRAYRLYVPTGYTGGPLPLLVPHQATFARATTWRSRSS
jgi:hypothetical protein